ncbi:MAG: KTSC domain-containing protein [Bacteroidetes bacterium]|nr:KTSC domain-containing protein [Bacteroidota bacterium]MBK9414272.1 KTSC domain-containing protein [Bacteroidota bacterium]MBL0030829.1 KTSC domain-containing protein [Bacteroidota bacterium]MBP9789725.1 KTSC domain-containing protein [Bacteroidia bacterium]
MPSSVIKTYHYDPETKELKIVFVSGLIYKYREVPEEIFLRMKGYTSKGAFLNKFIKRNFVFERID